MDSKECLQMAKENDVEIVDLKFCDVPSQWQHFSIRASQFSEDLFEQGIGFDGSSIRGFQSIYESDMLLVPDPDAVFLDAFTDIPTLSIVCNVQDPMTGQRYQRDPRYVAHKAETYLKSSGVADVSY